MQNYTIIYIQILVKVLNTLRFSTVQLICNQRRGDFTISNIIYRWVFENVQEYQWKNLYDQNQQNLPLSSVSTVLAFIHKYFIYFFEHENLHILKEVIESGEFSLPCMIRAFGGFVPEVP